MNTPARQRNPEDDKRNAVRLVVHAVRKSEEADRKIGVAIRFAIEVGASMEEIAHGTGLPVATVERLADGGAVT